MQIDGISLEVIAASGGALPKNSHMLYSIGAPDIRTSDKLIDESTKPYNVDSTTSSGKIEYRAEGIGEQFDENHLELLIVRVVGK